jgi:hypothetical protein
MTRVRSILSLCALVCGVTATRTARADDDALTKYRRGWNPMSGGPQLVSSADLHPQGQFFVKAYVYSEFGYAQYGAGWSTSTQSLAQKPSVLNPQIEVDYGIADHLEVDLYVSEVSWWETSGNGQPADSAHGVGDTTAFLKYRFLLQQPDTWWPSLTFASFIALPTSSWLDTPSVPGGFAPLGRLPATHFGAPELTEALLFRKNVRPFRISGGLYYSYGIPSSNGGVTQRFGDIVQYRLVGEHFLDDAHGLGYALEIIGLHGLSARADGRGVNAGKKTFGLIGAQPTIEYKFSDRIVGSFGVLFTAAGDSDIAAVYPNLSLYYYFSRSGKVMPR